MKKINIFQFCTNFHYPLKSTSKHIYFYSNKQKVDLNYSWKLDEKLKQLSEFQNGIKCLNERKFILAEYHLRDCLNILKNIRQGESIPYIQALTKYSEVLYRLKRKEDCEKCLHSAVEISEKVFGKYSEQIFPYLRNQLALYTHSNITKANKFVDEIISKKYPFKQYFIFAGAVIKLLNKNELQAQKLINQSLADKDLPIFMQAYNHHNNAVLMRKMAKSSNESQYIRESFINYKQCLYYLERNGPEKKNKMVLLKDYLMGDICIPNNDIESLMMKSMTNPACGLTLSNIAEMFLDLEKPYEKEAAFWLKFGLKHIERFDKESIPRHLILLGKFYSRLGQTLIGEGLYRKAIEILTNLDGCLMWNSEYLIACAMNNYGALLANKEKRENEAKNLVEQSKKKFQSIPSWYDLMSKVRFLDFDFPELRI